MKSVFLVAALAAVVAVVLTYTFAENFVEPRNLRAPASAPENYETLKACEKQEVLWKEMQATVHQTLPEYRKFGPLQLMAMSKQHLTTKGGTLSDFAPEGWKKYIHGRGSIVKVKIVPKNNNYTGIFQGAECALLRLSLTYRPGGSRAVAPGLALKVLRDGIPSANVSALVSLSGQDKNYNFFKNPMSNIVPMGTDLGQKLVHSVFSKVSNYPEELLVEDMASFSAHGEQAKDVASPRQLFFVPGPDLKFTSTEHDVRNDFAKIPENTLIYQLRVTSPEFKNFDYTKYASETASSFLDHSEHIADIITTSEFISSEFGDDGIFFKHQIRSKE